MEEERRKRIAVIGAGASGLTAIKCCLDEGLEPVCFDKSTDVGGLWRFHENIEDDRPSVFRSTVINTSKEFMSFSDFPIPKEYPNFMLNTYVMSYFRLYAEKFGLLEHIKFRKFVESIHFADDYDTTGKWEAIIIDLESNERKKEIFDGVLICTGHHTYPYKPHFKGIENFKGKIVHTHDYKDFHGYEGKSVLIIGIGNSGCDAATELCRVTSQVYLSTRQGAWVINRVNDNGLPVDMVTINRAFASAPLSLANLESERKLNWRFDHALYGLRPKHSFLSAHPTVNDDLPNCILNGRIKVKANVREFTGTGAVFIDGTSEQFDVVLTATGYTFAFPFLDPSVVKVEKNQVDLYKNVFPPKLKHPTLAVIGLIQPWGAVNPISEIQSRWATRVFKGLAKLPDFDKMMADIRDKKEKMRTRYVKSQRHTIQVDLIPCMDEIAELIGVKPNFYRMLLSDFSLARSCVLGPWTPYQYRLVGPGRWKDARETIFTLWDRIYYPLQTRPLPQFPSRSFFTRLFQISVVIVIAAWIFLKLC